MINVIKPDAKREIKCPYCGALINYDETDIMVFNKPKFYRDKKVISCPQCFNIVIVEQIK